MTDPDWIEACLSGGDLDEASHLELERQLVETPNNLELRIKRLGFLFVKELPRAREVLWLVTQHPGIDLGGFTVFRREEDPDVYQQIRLAWEQLVKRSPENSVYASKPQASRRMTSPVTPRRSIARVLLWIPQRLDGPSTLDVC
jgi:hypothetical protein